MDTRLDTTRLIRLACVAVLGVVIVLLAGAQSASARPVSAPVHRFYNTNTGTHFYTASEEERLLVATTWPTVFVYEGPVFETFTEDIGYPELDACRVPLFRFYNTRNGSHFYTMSAAERDRVIASYPGIYTYEGEAFSVFTEEALMWDRFYPVYRFYNRTNGSHFYTISETEKALVQIRWGSVYRYEGIAFWSDTYHTTR